MRRYDQTPILGFGSMYGTSKSILTIRDGIKNGSIRYDNYVLQENQRLGTVAGMVYGDEALYWVIAAASNIGYALQCPAGTNLKIPSIADVTRVLSG